MIKTDGVSAVPSGRIPGVSLPVSRIVFGAARSPFLEGGDVGAILDSVLELGITAIDTARVYGESERCLGAWMKSRNCRKDVVIIGKGGHPDGARKRLDRQSVFSDLSTSLELLGTDRIDVYMLHRDDPDLEPGAVAEMMNALADSGLICAYGLSNWKSSRIREICRYAAAHGLRPPAMSSPGFCLADIRGDLFGGGSVSISGPEGEAERRFYRESGMPVLSFSSLGRGFFSGRLKSSDWNDRAKQLSVLEPFVARAVCTPDNFERLRRCEILAERLSVGVAQIALAWAFGEGLDLYAAVSAHTPQRLGENIRAASVRLDGGARAWLDLKTDSLPDNAEN